MGSVRQLVQRIEDRSATIGVIGLGYVGLPLAMEMARTGYRTIGFDVNAQVVSGLNSGESYIQDVTSETVKSYVTTGMFSATSVLSKLGECDVILVCVPTPLNKTKDPDLSFVEAAIRATQATLHPGQLIVLESTTYPGTTREVVLPILEEGGLVVGTDFFLCYSPERVDPGNPAWRTRNTPKVLGGVTSACQVAGNALYSRVFDTLVLVSSVETAELVKVYENTFRMINIALANEIAQACDRLGIDVWEVVEAAATKPFGFMRFTPGPGVGGHCIPLDPHYLSWKLRGLAFKTQMIELASEINERMPEFVVNKIVNALNEDRLAVNGSSILVLGVAYKRDIGDVRESPALEIIRMLQTQGANVSYHDPHCPVINDFRDPLRDAPMRSVELDDRLLRAADAVVIATDHTAVDYERVAEQAWLVVDTRGVMRTVARGKARVIGLSGAVRDPVTVLSIAPADHPLRLEAAASDAVVEVAEAGSAHLSRLGGPTLVGSGAGDGASGRRSDWVVLRGHGVLEAEPAREAAGGDS